ncbi:MAG TPA: hypothetical protein PLO89_07155 [Spirochaetota bacterium]|nr:hypothetical protein [Spirochaetota bacterium]
MRVFKVLWVLFIFFGAFSCSKGDKILKVDDVVSNEYFRMEMETFGKWEEMLTSSEINEEKSKQLMTESIANFKKIKEYFTKLNSANNPHLNDAIKNQIDLCGEYERMESDFLETNESQKSMKYFYFANKHYNLFLENIEKARILEEEMEKQNEEK